MKTKSLLAELIGWLGIALVIGAYALALFDVLGIHSMPYLMMNIIGSACILFIAWYHKDIQPAVLNAIWILIALASIFR
jgi:hypothetical protein